MRPSHALIAILPCNDLDASEAFYRRLGFTRPESEKPAKGNDESYRMLSDGKGGHLASQTLETSTIMKGLANCASGFQAD